MLIVKAILVLIGVGIVNMLVVSIFDILGVLTMPVVFCIILEICGILGFLLYTRVLSPLEKLYNALNVIDFDKDVIDFSKLDGLDSNGSKELQSIINKFKYLLDIITERINRVNSASYKSEHDGLTGCYNRVHLDNMKNMYECSKSVTIIFIDVNNLKRMNDEFGHEAGDALLKSASFKLNFWNNYGDVYRMGGDEFMIVVLNKSIDYMKKLIDQWYPAVGQLNRDSDGFKCVLSYGVAHGQQGCNFDALQKQADDRMYDMKVALKKKFGEPLR